MSKSLDSSHQNRHSKTPSFSSILLDSIYRSLDDDVSDSNNPPIPPPTLLPSSPPTTTKQKQKQKQNENQKPIKKDKSVNLKRAIMIDHWIEKQQDQQQQLQLQKQQQQDQDERFLRHTSCIPSRKPNRRSNSCASAATPATTSSSSSSSSDSVIAGSCSDADFASCFTPQIALKIRTTDSRSSPPQPSSSLPFITRTKSRALKIYGDLKKSKQQSIPISPGAKIASFLNSIFSGANRNNKPRHSSPPPPPPESTTNSKSASSSSASGKRSVRFYPLSVIVGEDSTPCGHKFLYERSDSKLDRSVKSAKLTKMPNVGRSNPWYLRDEEKELRDIDDDDKEVIGEGEGDGEDGESYASSDLFELENMEELPVYGTTSFEKNKAIANGFLL